MKKILSLRFPRYLTLVLVLNILPSVPFGGCSGGIPTSTSATTRGMTGTLSSGTFAALSLNNKNAISSTCAELQLSCFNYSGTATSVDVSSDCSFDITLDLNNFYYCALLVKASSSFLGTLGCTENSGFAAALPIFADASGGTGTITAGTGLTISSGQIAADNICRQVDQDGDGTSDADDSDDDGDGIADTVDTFNESGCELADSYDSDANGVPDLFETTWAGLTDADGDTIPNFCDFDVDGDGYDNDADADDDGDGTLDTTDTDILGDGLDDSGDQDHDGVDDAHAVSCEFTSCANDFQCQIYSDSLAVDVDLSEKFEVLDFECVDNCCELIQ